MKSNDTNENGRWVYCRYIRRNGKIIYPKNAQFFRFWVSNDK